LAWPRDKIARVNAVHIGDARIKPSEITTEVVNASGVELARETKTVPPGKAIYFDFEFNVSLEGNRQQLRTLIGARDPASPDQHLKISIEVFDGDTGENAAYIVL
jgi:hypothetical protein